MEIPSQEIGITPTQRAEGTASGLPVIPDLRPLARLTPLKEHVPGYERFASTPLDRRGIQFTVRHADAIIFEKTVWQTGRQLPFRPFYEKRLNRARKEARSLVGALAVASEHSPIE